MRIAVSSESKELTGQVDPRFGRAQYFIIYDTDSEEFQAIDNQQSIMASHGAGIQAAQNVADQGVEVVVSGNFGPKAFATLSAAGIKAVLWADGTVEEAIELVRRGRLQFADQSNVERHWM